MGFVGSSSNIDITTYIPLAFCVLYCKHQIVYGIYILFFMLACSFGFVDVETNLGPWCPILTVCRLLCNNVRGFAGNLSDLAMALSRYDILLCSETLVSDMCHMYELLVPGSGHPVLLCRGRMPRA